MKKLFFCLSVFLFLFSCTKKDAGPNVTGADAEISKVLEKFYEAYGKSSETLYSKPIAKDVFTPEIKNEIEEIISASRKDMERIRKSVHPEDKPLILEGSVFTSLYEGYTQYKINSIKIRDLKPEVKIADVTVGFENASVSPKIQWSENVHLVNSPGNTWRIDNITFDKIAQVKDLKTRLNDLRAEFK
ncbi:hypothetical protein [uncultured Chryseobacterium sp.]|uniref:hypothetical protein n=1 Tax=uncultured Chryseobacterium sp. TaxID=259322 RepID=UPI0025E5F260|nr:hypothetical protein [uncultured Chryseobacterium sp.]